MMDGKVMVTGGAGYVRSHAVLALLDAGYDVVVDNPVTGFEWPVDPCADLVVADVADTPVMRATIRDHRARAILHSPARWWCRNRSATRLNITATTRPPHVR